MADDDRPRWVPPRPSGAELVAGAVAGAAGRVAAPVVRGAIQGGLQNLFRGEQSAEGPPPVGDAGWFGPGSVVWRVHADTSMFVGGIAALLFQALHPRAMAGVSDHSDFRADPLGRLRRTAAFVGTTAYGTTAEAEAACAAVREIHNRIIGTTPDGRPYDANDPELLDWVHVAEFSMFAAAHRRYSGAPMSRAELDTYVAEVARIARELGDPEPPTDWRSLDRALERHRPNLAVGEQAREADRFLASAPVPGPARPAYQVLYRGAIACLPPWARKLWGLPGPAVTEIAACRALVRGLGATLGRPPGLAAAEARVDAA